MSHKKLKHLASLLEKHLEDEELSDKNWTDADLEEFHKVKRVLEHVNELIQSNDQVQPISLQDTNSLQELLSDIKVSTDSEVDSSFQNENQPEIEEETPTSITDLVEEVPVVKKEEEVLDIAKDYATPSDDYTKTSNDVYNPENTYGLPKDQYAKADGNQGYAEQLSAENLQKTFDEQAYKPKTQTEEEMEAWDKDQEKVWYDESKNQYKGGQE